MDFLCPQNWKIENEDQMTTGRPPKPSAIHELSGAWAKKPQRARTDVVARSPIDLNGFPNTFSGEEIEAWQAIINNAPIGVLKNSDTLLVAAAARIEARLRNVEKYSITTTQLMQLTGTLRQLLNLMGMTPADRCRVTSDIDDCNTNDFDPLAEFAT
jgi:hypothetical protein